MPKHRIFTTPFAKVYPMYVQKEVEDPLMRKIRDLDKLIDDREGKGDGKDPAKSRFVARNSNDG